LRSIALVLAALAVPAAAQAPTPAPVPVQDTKVTVIRGTKQEEKKPANDR
jgi:hypothetical protein